MANDTRRKLYTALNNAGFDIGSYEDFDRRMNNQADRKKFYDAVSNAGYDIGDYDAFNKRITPSKYSLKIKGVNTPVSEKEYKDFVSKHQGQTAQPAKTQTTAAKQPRTQPAAQAKQAAAPAPATQQAPTPMQFPDGFGQFDVFSTTSPNAPQFMKDMEAQSKKDREKSYFGGRSVSEKEKDEQRESLDIFSKSNVEKAKKAMQQRMDEIQYEQETGERMRQPIDMPFEAPTLARDEDGNVLYGEDGKPLIGRTTDKDIVNTHQLIKSEQQAYDQKQIDLQDAEKQARDRLREVDERLKTINQARTLEFMDKEKNKSFWDRLLEAFRMPTINGRSPYEDWAMSQRSDEEMNLINSRRILEYGLSIVDDARKDAGLSEGPWYEKAGKGISRAYGKAVEVASNPETWDFGAGDMEKQFALLRAVIKEDNGEASPSDKKLLDDFAVATFLQGNYEDKLSGWTKAGLVTGESLPFMLEMFANPAAGIGRKASEGLLRYSIKKYGTKYVRDHIKQLTAKKIATRILGDVVAAHTMAATTGAMRTLANTYERMRGDINTGVDENGRIIYDGHEVGESAFDAFSKAWRSTAIENWSEMAGDYLPFMTGFFGNAIGKAAIGKAGREALKITGSLESVGLNKAQRFIYDLAANKGIGAFSKGLDDFLKRTQWHGVLGEYSEEVLGNIANAITVGDMTLDTAEGTGVFNLQQNIDTFNGVALMGGFTSALQTGAFGIDRYRNSVSRRDSEGSKVFGSDWERIKTAIDSSADDARELNNVLTDFLGSGMMDKNQKKAVLNYTSAMLQSKGAEMTQYQPRMQSSKREEVSTPDGKRYIVTSLDKNGDTIDRQTFDSEDEATAFEGELKMKQQWNDLTTYLDMTHKPSMAESDALVNEFLTSEGFDDADDITQSAMLAAINDPSTPFGKRFQQFRIEKTMEKAQASQDAIAAFEEENGWTPGTVKWLAEQDPMELDDEGLQMADKARDFLETLAYPPNEVHVEHEQEKGADVGKAVVEQVVSIEEPIEPLDNQGQLIADQWLAAKNAYDALLEKNEDLEQEINSRGMLSEQEIVSSLDSFRPEEVQTVIDYFNAKARYEGFMNEASHQIDAVTQRERNRRTFRGTINGEADTSNLIKIVDGDGNQYALVSGNVNADSDGHITGSSSGLVIGVDDLGDLVSLGDKHLTIIPERQSLDEWEANERARLQEQVTATIDPTGALAAGVIPPTESEDTGEGGTEEAPAGEQVAGEDTEGGNAGGEAGAEGTGGNEPPASAPVTIESVTDEDGVKHYEDGISEEDAVADMIASGDNPIEIADASIAEADEAIKAINDKPTKTRKDLANRKKHENVKKYYEDIKSHYVHTDRADGTSVTQIGNRVIIEKDGKIVYDTAGVYAPIPTADILNPPTGPETPPTPPADETPDVMYDTPAAARERGYIISEGHRIDRQEEKPMPTGKEVEVQYSTKDKVKGHLTVSELGEVQGSHLTNGQRNLKHYFLSEAQPKGEFGSDRQTAAQVNASEENFRPELMLTFNDTQSAYSGSTAQTNRRGEVIQGNGRRNLAEYIYAPGNEAVAKRYKEYLMAHAEELGTTAEEIAKMEKPFAHIVLDVTDEEAIRLGQFTAQDLETGGKKVPDVTTTITKLGDSYGSFANIVLEDADPDASLAERIEGNAERAIKWLNQGGYINDTEAKTLLEDKSLARQFVKDMITDTLFRGASPELRSMFYELPKNIQSAIVSVVGREVTMNQDTTILKDIQESILAYHELMSSSPAFAKAKGRTFEERYNAVTAAVNDWLRQLNIDGSENSKKYSNFALELAKRYKSYTDQKTLRSQLQEYYDLVSGASRQLNMFEEEPVRERLSRDAAIKKVFGINNEENGEQGVVPLAGDDTGSEEGGQGQSGDTESGEQEPEGEQPPVGGRGDTGDAGEGVGGETPPTPPNQSEREQFIAEHPLTENEIQISDAPNTRKLLALKYLSGENETQLAKAAYLSIYNKKVAAQGKPEAPKSETPKPQKPTAPKNETPAETKPDETPSAGSQSEATASAQAKVNAILARMKQHKKPKNDDTDAYSIEKLTPEQLDDMLDLIEAGAELGYSILDTVSSQEEWLNEMRGMIGEPLKDATGYTDAEVDELLKDLWNAPHNVEGQEKTVAEWASEKGINTNENNNGEGESTGGTPQGEQPGNGNLGSSAKEGVGEQPENDGGDTGDGGETGNGSNSGVSDTGSEEGQPSPRPGSRGTTSRAEGTSNGGTGRGGTRSGTGGRGGRSNETGRTQPNGKPASVPAGGGSVGRNAVAESPKKPIVDISKEKTPYKPASIGGKYAIGSVIPSGIADAISNSFKRLKEKFFKKKSILDFVREELGYKSNEEMLSDFESGKTDGLAAEQVDAVAMAIGKMKEGKSFIVGDMTGVGKGRTAAALIRWGKQHGKKVLFITEKSSLFSDMYRDLTDIGCDYMPFVTNNDKDANITDGDDHKVFTKPTKAAQSALWQSGSDKLPKNKKGRQYDFVMTTYSQASNPKGADAKKKLEWLKEYAKDAIIIMDESHNASGESNRGEYFKELVKEAGGVTFLSATYAKRPDNMLLYALRSSMSELHMSVGDMLQAIKNYGVAMQEMMASALFGSGEMIRRERDMSDVKTTWTEPKELYKEEEYEQCRKTSDKTMDLVNDIIDFQREYINPIVKKHEKEYEGTNLAAALTGSPQTHATNTSYKSQVSNIVGLMVYAMKAKKAAEMAIEQIKHGKKPVIAVENTFGSYVDELGDEVSEANFRPIFEKGIRFSLKYTIAQYEKGDDGKYHKNKDTEQVYDAEEELDDDGARALENLRQRVEEYIGDPDKIDLTLSPIDLVKQMIADAGYNCGEITGRNYQLERKEGGGFKKVPFSADKKGAARKFNGGSKDNPIPKEEQYQALILNVAGATGISLHSSKRFGNQDPRTMIILQPARDVNTEVQMRGRIDRTGQVHRGEYFYVTSPIPAEQKLTMMLKQKLASLDAQSVGTKKVSSNKVESQDMDNKYGDEVCYNYLLEHLQDVNAYLENGLKYDNKTRQWVGRPNLLYEVLKDLQRMPCDMQEKVINELSQRYADHIDYLNQNGINDLETTTMDLEAVTIDKATFVKGKDNESVNEFAHDTTIERVEVNVLKKPMRSSDIKKKMKDLDALDEDGLPKEGVLGQTNDKVQERVNALYENRKTKYEEQEKKLEDKIRKEHPQKESMSDDDYEKMISNWPTLLEMRNAHKADLAQYGADLQNQQNEIYKAGMYLKPGRPYLVPLTDDISSDSLSMYGRFLGFQLKNGDPRQVQAVFVVKDSRAMIAIPVVNKKNVIAKIIQDRNDMEIVALGRNDYGEELPMEERSKKWDEWWDKMIPKNTNRQIRYMITGNVLQACGSLGKYKGQIVTFTRKNKETGEITLERGMLLAENFDPENFRVRRGVEKKDVWDSYDEVKDATSGISCHREGNNMVVKFEKRKGEKLVDHPVQKDQTMKDLAMNGEIRASGKTALLCVVKEENVEKALEHLYKEYGYTKEELFVMPDSTEKPDAIIRSNRPYQEIINEYAPKYGNNKYSVQNKIRQMLKRYKMDVNNEGLKNDIREAVQLRQAYLRKEYSTQESNRLAWEVLVLDQRIEEYKDDKDYREELMRRREAILEELEYRGFKGTALHLEQGKMTLDDVRNLFDQLNDTSTEEGKFKKALFEKVMAKLKKLPMEIYLNEKIDNDTGGWAGGRVISYNWKYMNADYISDDAKASTILHEMIHTVTAYADRCVESGLEHLLDQDMIDAINELHSIFDAIKDDDTFTHDGVRAYGLTNVREMLSEAGSNSEFRADLKKTGLWVKVKTFIMKFFGIKPGEDMPGARKVNAYDAIMERLDLLIENFKQEAWEEFYKGTAYGGYGYKKKDAQKIDTFNPMDSIEQSSESWRRERAQTKSRARERRRREYAERQWRRAHDKATNTIKTLGLSDNTTVVDYPEQLPSYGTMTEQQKTSKGWFDENTGNIVVIIGNHTSPEDVQRTILRESVARYGLRRLFGKNYTNFLDNVLDNADTDVRREIMNIAESNGNDLRKATEEYLARLANDTDFERAMNQNWWSQIKRLFMEMLHSIGLTDWIGDYLSDNELRYMLWRSYVNLTEPNARRNVFNREDTSKREDLNVGDYAGRSEPKVDVSNAAESGRRFDEDLEDKGVAEVQQPTGHKQRIAKHIDALVEKLGTKARTTVHHSLDDVPENVRKDIEAAHKRGRKVRGWYENGEVHLFLPDIDSEYQAEKTIWHETVAHHGLRQLIGAENLNKLLKQLWLTHKDGEMGKWVTERMQKNGWSLSEAIEEYLAREAEKNPFKEPGLWQRLRWMVAEVLHKMGFASDPTISDIQYLFWLSQNRLNENDPMSKVKQQAFLFNLEREAENTPYVNMNAERVEDIYDPEAEGAYPDGRTIRHSEETDEEVLERLEKEPKVKVYRAMQLKDGKLYPPMAAKVNGEWQEPMELGKWARADEHPELVNKDGKFDLDKGNGKKVNGVVYAPYMHGSTTMLNDQFKEAQDRPELVVVEAEMPESELTSGYQAEKSPRKTGMLDWKAGTIQGQLTGTRQVMLSRWVKPIRIVPSSEVAANIKEMIDGQVEVMPTNVVTPEQREELEKLGVKFVKTNNKEIIQEGEHKGEQYSSVYGKKASTKSKRTGRRYDEDIDDPLTYSAKEVYNERLNRVETVFTEAYQDAMVSLKTAQNAIAKDEEIPDSQNAYMAENLMHGKTKNEQDTFNKMLRDPLIRTINKILNLTGMNWGDVDRYVYTKSGLERNREFYVRDWLEKEMNKRIRRYEDLNEDEQRIYDQKAAAIEQLFDDGDIDEEEKNKRLKQALQDSHTEYLNDLKREWQFRKSFWDKISFPSYLQSLDEFIRKNIDDEYDPSEHDYSGFRAMFGDENGKYNEDAIIDELMDTEDEMNSSDEIAGHTTDTLWEQIRACTRYGLERYREAGMRSDEQIDQVEQMFHFYVPMRGFKESRGEDMYQYFTGKDSSKSYVGGLLKHAKGRGSEASYPISTIFAMTYKAISDCNQNMVNQKLYRLCQANSNDLIVLSDSWAVYNEVEDRWEESCPEIPDDASEEEVRQITLAWEEHMRELAKDGKAKKITGKARFDYKPMDKKKQSEHIVDVRINGQPKKMIVTSNPRMAQALNGQLRFERGKNFFSKWNAAIKNFMSSLFTSYSPTFALRNMFRDWTHFRMMLGVREGHGYAKQASKYYRQSLFKMVGLFKKYREGTLDESNEMERDFKDFMDNGGVTGYVHMQKIDDIQKEMKKLYKRQKEGKVIRLNNKVWDYTLGAIEAVNEGIENNARFATYRASRHYAGRTRARSAYDAKEITVNFNRKGAGSKSYGFKSQNKRVEDAAKIFGVTSQVLGEGRIFFNATVQAIATTFKNFQHEDGSLNKPYIAKWFGKYALPPFMFGLLLPLVNKMLAAAFGGGDDDDPYANLPDWTRRKNLCFYIGNDNFITIPIGQELAAFLTLGDIAAGLTYAQELKPVDKGWDDEMLGVMSTFSPVDIETKVTDKDGVAALIPNAAARPFSVLAPIVAVSENISWTGRPIYKEDRYPTDKYKPEYQQVYQSTNPVLVGASKLLHEIGGGDDNARGKDWSEVNPGIVQYLWEQYTGGPGKVFSNAISIGKDAKDLLVNGEAPDFNIRKVEGLKAFVQQGDDRTQYYRTQAKFYKYQEDADKFKHDHDITNLEKQAENDGAARLKLERLQKTKEYQRYAILKEANRSSKKEGKVGLDDMQKDIKSIEDPKKKRNQQRAYNILMKEVVDMLDDVKAE